MIGSKVWLSVQHHCGLCWEVVLESEWDIYVNKFEMHLCWINISWILKFHPNWFIFFIDGWISKWAHMSLRSSQITGNSTIYQTAYSSWQERNKQSSALQTLCVENPWNTATINLGKKLPPNDIIWWQRYWSTMAQIMAWCLTAPSHYLNQCWLKINGIHPSTISQMMH